jgi:Fur family iron response transcriptional regulator
VSPLDRLRQCGIQPSAQRLAVAEHVLVADHHPSAEEIYRDVRRSFPMISRATVYNSLNLFVEKGLLRALVLAEGRTVYDPHTAPHHHFIDEKTGEILDIPWNALRVSKIDSLDGFDVREYQVVVRGRRRAGRGGRTGTNKGGFRC